MASKTQQQYHQEMITPLKKQAEEMKAQRTAADAQQLEQINAAIDKATKTAAGQYEQRIAALPGESRALYDKNAMNEAISRTQIQERLANMGVTDSGLTSSMQTALTVQKGKADRQVAQNEQQQRQALMAAIDEIVANGEGQKAAQKLKMDQATREWYDNLSAQMEQTAQTNAATAYAADQEYAAKMEAANIEAQNKAAEKLADYENQRRQYVQKLLLDNSDMSTEQAWANGYALYPATEAEDKNYESTNTYYTLLRSGYTPDEVTAYMQAGGGDAGSVAVYDAAAAKAEAFVPTLKLDITKFLGKTWWHNQDNDGRLVAESINEQLSGNTAYAAMSKTEQEMTRAAAIGQMVATSWSRPADAADNKTRLKIACDQTNTDYDTALAFYEAAYG